MKGKLTTVILIIVFIAGFSLLLYPTVSDYWNSFRQSKAIASYSENIAAIDTEKYAKLWEEAKEFNQSLLKRRNWHVLTDEQEAIYPDMLKISEDGVLGYIEIPSIKCSLPIYHGTSDAVLQVAVGHLEWTSLPTGGTSTHTVLSGHRGLPSAKLFTNLDQVVVGDVFMLRVLDEVLTYEVDAINIVEPDDTELLKIVEGEDYCTLVTCTPYGVNSHRLLVRGHRVENIKESGSIRVTADAVQIEPMIIAPIVAVPIILIFMVILIINDKKTGHGGKKDED